MDVHCPLVDVNNVPKWALACQPVRAHTVLRNTTVRESALDQFTTLSAATWRPAIRHLRTQDPILGQVISRVGPCQLKPKRHRFRTLLGAIIGQQISTSAAQTIRQRVEQLVRPGVPTPSKIAKIADSQLRSAGLSRQKVSYVRDLVDQSLAGNIHYRDFSRMTDREVIQNLVQVKGIGEWTAQMFLIFSLGRQDVFPYDDLGIRNAIRKLYRLQQLPEKDTCCRLAAPWRPYSSIASWYCWQSLKIDDLHNEIQAPEK